MSDIDLLPIYTDSTDPSAQLDRRRAELVGWWAASGRAQTLNMGWLAWHRQATDALAEATRVRTDDPAKATYLLRESACSFRLVLIERWGERLGSMGREWTRFVRMADLHGEQSLAAWIAVLAGADTSTAAQRAPSHRYGCENVSSCATPRVKRSARTSAQPRTRATN